VVANSLGHTPREMWQQPERWDGNLPKIATHKVGFFGRIGGDALGKMALERLAAAGVDVSRVRQVTMFIKSFCCAVGAALSTTHVRIDT
jgi:hypothetical protein